MPARLTPAEYAALAAIVVIWGVNNAAAKVATEALPPLLVGALRFAIAGLALAPFVRPPFPHPRKLAALVVACGTLHFALLYPAFALAEDLSALVVSLQLWIPFTALLSWLALKEPLSRPAALGLVTAFAGVAWMTADPVAFRDWKAIAVGAASSLVWAAATLAARRAPMPPLKLQGLLSLAAAPALMAGTLAFEPGWTGALVQTTPLVWASILWSGLASTVVATGLLFWLVQRRETGRVTPYLLLTPVVSVGKGAGLLGDVLTGRMVLGAGVAMAGVAGVALAERGLRAGASGSAA